MGRTLAGVEALAEKACAIFAEAHTVQDTADECSSVKDALGLCAWALALAQEMSVAKSGAGRVLARLADALTEGVLQASHPLTPCPLGRRALLLG
jgi:hypothetical protein